jgi:hypothetical protein
MPLISPTMPHCVQLRVLSAVAKRSPAHPNRCDIPPPRGPLAPQLNAAAGTRDGGERGLYASKTIPARGLIAKIPLAAAIFFPNTSSFAELGSTVAEEAAAGPASRWAPYLATLPMARDPGHTLNFATFPPEYIHLLLSELMVGAGRGVAWRGVG